MLRSSKHLNSHHLDTVPLRRFIGSYLKFRHVHSIEKPNVSN